MPLGSHLGRKKRTIWFTNGFRIVAQLFLKAPSNQSGGTLELIVSTRAAPFLAPIMQAFAREET
jgi:hypothetical protein